MGGTNLPLRNRAESGTSTRGALSGMGRGSASPLFSKKWPSIGERIQGSTARVLGGGTWPIPTPGRIAVSGEPLPVDGPAVIYLIYKNNVSSNVRRRKLEWVRTLGPEMIAGPDIFEMIRGIKGMMRVGSVARAVRTSTVKNWHVE